MLCSENLAFSLCLFCVFEVELGYFPHESHSLACALTWGVNCYGEWSSRMFFGHIFAGAWRTLSPPSLAVRRQCQDSPAAHWAFIPALFLAVISCRVQGQSAPDACKNCSLPNFTHPAASQGGAKRLNLLLQNCCSAAVLYKGSLTHSNAPAHRSAWVVRTIMKSLIQQISTMFGEYK